MNDPATGTADRMRKEYMELFGRVPALVEQRVALAELTDRFEAIETIEDLRKVLISGNPLGLDRQQLVHFGQLVVLGNHDAASRHAAACRKNGATAADLIGVVETALITAGVPAYNLGIEILHDLFIRRNEAHPPDPGDQR